MRLATTILLLSLGTPSVHGSLKLVKDLQVGAVRSVTLVGLPEADEVALQAEHFLGSPDITLGRLITYESEHTAKLAMRESELECSVHDIDSFLKANGVYAEPSRCPLVWEVIKIGPNMLQRSVDRNCRTRKVLLRGTSDPLLIRSEGAAYEILHVSMRVDHPSVLAGEGRYPSIEIFVRTKADLRGSESAVKRILLDIKKLSEARYAGIRVLNDELFDWHCAFPVLYFFDDAPPVVPKPDDPRLRRAELDCGSVYPSADAHCFYYPPDPNR